MKTGGRDRPVNNCGNALICVLWGQEEQTTVKAQIMEKLILLSEAEALKDEYNFPGREAILDGRNDRD